MEPLQKSTFQNSKIHIKNHFIERRNRIVFTFRVEKKRRLHFFASRFKGCVFFQVELMDGGNAQLSLVKGDETTAGQLHDSMCKELKLNAASGSLFAIWICSERLSNTFIS